MPGRRSRVFIFAGVDAACRPLPEPSVEITTPPKQGDITFVPGQDTSIATSANGTCNGARSKGVGVYYTAREGATGSDHFTVTARLPSGEAFARSFDVRIAE
ncbi:MAG: hypothetical protein JSS20_04180 [Proteobacteria bacterium]|nr:hypothetical protein [Pseudomonadota bacterium]